MNVAPILAGTTAPATPTFGLGPLATPEAAAADQAAPTEAFSALLARLIPGRVPIPLPLSGRGPGGLATDGAETEEHAGDVAAGELTGEYTVETRAGAAREGSPSHPAAATGAIGAAGAGSRPGPTAATRATSPGGDRILALAAAVAAMAGDTETASRLAAEATSGIGDDPIARLTTEPAPNTRDASVLPDGSAPTGHAGLASDSILDASGPPARGIAGSVRGEVVGIDPSRAGGPNEIPTPVVGGLDPAESAAFATSARSAPASDSTAAPPREVPGPSAAPVRAATNAPRVGAPDPARVEKSLELLHPEFRVRLERVVTRMAEEHGHDVDIVETLRHQVRQNQLYEQGRSRPGDIVTWTRASNHATGGAADVIIDGSYDNPTAYARLQRIAAQEGLRTLGARDPGHLELPVPGDEMILTSTESADASEPRLARAETLAPAAGRSADRVARPARVAAVADLARLARVEAPAVARVATPGAPAASSTGGSSTAPAGRAAPPADDRIPAAVPGAPQPGTPAPDAPRFDGGLFASTDASRSTAPAERLASPALTSGAAERIAHLLDLQSAAPMKPLSQVFLRVDGPGGEDRIRLDLRGGSIAGSIDLNDPIAAERLGARIGDLHRALEQRGLEAEALKVRSTPRTEVLDRVAFAAPVDSETVRSASHRNGDSAFQRERPQSDHSRDEPREGSHDARQRNRKDNPGGKSS